MNAVILQQLKCCSQSRNTRECLHFWLQKRKKEFYGFECQKYVRQKLKFFSKNFSGETFRNVLKLSTTEKKPCFICCFHLLTKIDIFYMSQAQNYPKTHLISPHFSVQFSVVCVPLVISWEGWDTTGWPADEPLLRHALSLHLPAQIFNFFTI